MSKSSYAKRKAIRAEARKQGKPGVQSHVDRFITAWAHMRTSVFTREGAGSGGIVYRYMKGDEPQQVELGRKRTTIKSRYSAFRKPWQRLSETFKGV